jgi:type I restriction enzyme M protein
MAPPRKEGLMSVLTEFMTGDVGRAIALLTDDERSRLEARASVKDGKLFLRCFARDKLIRATPEEVVRQLWLDRLVQQYGYPLDRLKVEVPIVMGRDASKKADIVIIDADRPDAYYAIIEVKKVKAKDGKEQLRSYTNATGAPLALWSRGAEDIVWNRKDPNYFEEIDRFPHATETIESVLNEPWTIADLIAREDERASKREKARTLRDVIVDLEDEVLANAGVDVFEEVFKLVFVKLYDEMECFRGSYQHLKFRNNDSASVVKARLEDLFVKAKRKWPGVFPEDAKIRLSPEHLQICVGSLEKWKLFNSNLDVIDDAFEYLVLKTSKAEKGQYFTPRWVIDMCVKMLNPGEAETVIDTAAGSAGFTVHTMFHVWNRIMDRLGKPRSNLFTMEAKEAACVDYVRDNVFAIDFDDKSVRVARCLNLIAGDGETNVLHLNSLDWKRWNEAARDDDWNDAYAQGWQRLRRLRASNDNRSYSFNIVMANPPFAGDIKQSAILATYELAHKPSGKLEHSTARDLLFIERNLDMLKPGGRMAIVLPQGRFNNSTDKRVREYIMQRCRILAVVALHPNTFKPHTGTKTSVLIVQKWNDTPDDGPLAPRKDDYDIFFASQKLPSKDNSGEKIYVKGPDEAPLRDAHGHFIVQHDLFNHEGLTKDGIAEAFAQFAWGQGLSFAEKPVPQTGSVG